MLWSLNNNQKTAPSKAFTVQILLRKTGGGFLSFRRLVGYHQFLWIETNKHMLLGLRQHHIISPMAQNLRLGYSRTVNKSNDNLHTSFVKHAIYQNIHSIHNQDIYPLPTYLERSFEIFEPLITRLMRAVDKKFRWKITCRVKWSLEHKKVMDLV